MFPFPLFMGQRSFKRNPIKNPLFKYIPECSVNELELLKDLFDKEKSDFEVISEHLAKKQKEKEEQKKKDKEKNKKKADKRLVSIKLKDPYLTITKVTLPLAQIKHWESFENKPGLKESLINFYQIDDIDYVLSPDGDYRIYNKRSLAKKYDVDYRLLFNEANVIIKINGKSFAYHYLSFFMDLDAEFQTIEISFHLNAFELVQFSHFLTFINKLRKDGRRILDKRNNSKFKSTYRLDPKDIARLIPLHYDYQSPSFNNQFIADNADLLFPTQLNFVSQNRLRKIRILEYMGYHHHMKNQIFIFTYFQYFYFSFEHPKPKELKRKFKENKLFIGPVDFRQHNLSENH